MTQTEIRSAINKAVYIFAESLGYQISDDGDGSCVRFYKPKLSGSETIEYSRSQHETYVLNWSSDETKKNAMLIDEYASKQIAKYKS